MDDSDSPASENGKLPLRMYRRLKAWSQRYGLERKFSALLLLAAVLSGIATFAAMTGRLPGAGIRAASCCSSSWT
ncbi:hypothetical protein [Fodinicurvata halophila]|uniref:hypothetical protein n=1 Tax=Fodinicurvata halophila TaxID=1419723 RepID=UPI00363CC72C